MTSEPHLTMEVEETKLLKNKAREKSNKPTDTAKPLVAKASDPPAKIVPRSQAINVKKALESQPIPDGQNYIIYSYLLSSSQTNGMLGVQIYLGAYNDKAKAYSVASNIMRKTGVASIYVTEAGRCTPIDQIHKLDRTNSSETSLQTEEAIRNVFKEEKEREVKNLEHQIQIESEITAETLKKDDQSTIEAYAYNWYAYTKDRALYSALTERAEQLADKIAERAEKLRLQYVLHPELDDNGKWITKFKEKLAARGESELAAVIEAEYGIAKDLILPKETEEENGPRNTTHLPSGETDSNKQHGINAKSATEDPLQVTKRGGVHELSTEATTNSPSDESW